MAIPAGATGLTLEDLSALPDDGRRYELVDGTLHVTPRARRRHQWVITRITYRLHEWARRHGGRVYPGVNVDLADDTHLEPDVAYDPSEDVSGLAFPTAPALVVEVSSPSTKALDLGIKKDRYAVAGADEFWFVDLDQDLVLQFTTTRQGHLAGPSVHRRGETFTSELLPGLRLEVEDLLGPPEPSGSGRA